MSANGPHGWNSFTNYFEVHDKVMSKYDAHGFVLSNTIVATPLGKGNMLMEGVIQCVGDIEITVRKLMELQQPDGRETQIRTIDYSYNVRIVGVGNILRYDYPHPDHNQFHHVHRYDVLNGDTEGQVRECNWPTLGDVIGEIEKWYYDNVDAVRALTTDQAR